MANLQIFRARTCFVLPVFLAPAFAESFSHSSRTFTTSCCRNSKSKPRGKNKKRGVSAIRGTGPRQPLVSNYKFPTLPTPRPENERPLNEFPTKQDHGLYGFFNDDKKTVLPGEDEEAHGRAWTYQELMQKSFEDLHALYWTGIKEMNQIATRHEEHQRLQAGFGAVENEERMSTVKDTNDNIRKVLRDRQFLYEEARILTQTKSPQELFEEQPDFEEDEVDNSVNSESQRTTVQTQPS